jgi:hypothetical protein
MREDTCHRCDPLEPRAPGNKLCVSCRKAALERKYAREAERKRKPLMSCVGCGIDLSNPRAKTCTDCKSQRAVDKNRAWRRSKAPSCHCRRCGLEIEHHIRYCASCRKSYYDLYRPACEFAVNVWDYPEYFDLDLIRTWGWYSPTNKGNNLRGVSKDHMYSVSEGFHSEVDPSIVSHPANCKLMLQSENDSKNSGSSISLQELLIRIRDWDAKYSSGRAVSHR